MADDQDVLLRFLNMLRGSLDEKNQRLLEELRLKRAIILSRPAPDSPMLSPQEDEDSGPGLSPPGLSPGVAA